MIIIYWDLFLAFFKIGFASFGGGYGMIPIIEYEVSSHQWLTTQQFTDVVTVAGMSPGPIATNSAVFIGYKVGGIWGAIVATLAITIPSLFFVIVISIFVNKMKNQKNLYSVFYGLRPVVTGLIIYAAIKFAAQNEIIDGLHMINYNWIGILIVIAGIGLLHFAKMSPILLILISGITGVILYF
ncbi:chromate transporter [Bacillus sp. B-jedd]|uniref:chromate transporter n=1 Tax=Bacillus sp. B-jedd TaxID=1476857 RepID=UPI001E5169FE|nr:chromate transporter [Bacillus sp. B-jedd]